MNYLKRLTKDSSGATAIEYTLIAAGIAMVIVLAVGMLGGTIGDIFSSLADALGA